MVTALQLSVVTACGVRGLFVCRIKLPGRDAYVVPLFSSRGSDRLELYLHIKTGAVSPVFNLFQCLLW